mmetsp:Transcript_20791/g.32049  ORF Transcript_20791/g.32049 Transcript_20791/m.32049 type:complete len:309 (+) Transcript_20791:2782-3708(+)
MFEFSTFAHSHIQIYDNDDKLMVADQAQIRLWDFHDNKEDIPQLVTIMEAPLKIDCLKVNKFTETHGERAGVFYYVIACKDEFKVYHERLDLLLQGDINNKMDRISSIEFGLDLRNLYIGTEKGLIFKFYLPSPKQVEEYEPGLNGEAPKIKLAEEEPIKVETKPDYDYSVKLLYRVVGILEEDFFAIHVKYSGLKVWNEKSGDLNGVVCPEYKGEIDQIKATPNGQFLLVGFRDASTIMFFSIDKASTMLFQVEGSKITRDYEMFETDDNLTLMLFKTKKKSLELYAIKWEFETTKLDLKRLRKLDD